MSETPKTIIEIARAASDLMGLSIKTGAAQPLRDGMVLMDRLIAGDYERVALPAQEALTTQGDDGDENATKSKSEARKPKAKARARTKKARRGSRS